MCQQRTGDVAELMRDAAAVKPAYDKLLKGVGDIKTDLASLKRVKERVVEESTKADVAMKVKKLRKDRSRVSKLGCTQVIAPSFKKFA